MKITFKGSREEFHETFVKPYISEERALNDLNTAYAEAYANARKDEAAERFENAVPASSGLSNADAPPTPEYWSKTLTVADLQDDDVAQDPKSAVAGAQKRKRRAKAEIEADAAKALARQITPVADPIAPQPEPADDLTQEGEPAEDTPEDEAVAPEPETEAPAVEGLSWADFTKLCGDGVRAKKLAPDFAASLAKSLGLANIVPMQTDAALRARGEAEIRRMIAAAAE